MACPSAWRPPPKPMAKRPSTDESRRRRDELGNEDPVDLGRPHTRRTTGKRGPRENPPAAKVDLVSDESDGGGYRASTDVDEAVAPRKSTKHDEILATALERFALVVQAEDAQRRRELEDLQFDRALLEDHWPADLLNARKGSTEGGVVTPARPCFVIPKQDVPVQQVLNEAKRAKLSIRILPKSGNASKEGATLRQNMIRAIEQDSNAQVWRYWALDRAAKCGRGYYRVLSTYANDGDLDQDLVISGFENQASVYLDPYHKHPSAEDAEWAFVTDDMPRGEFVRDPRFRDTTMKRLLDGGAHSAEELQSINDASPGWVTSDNVRFAEYYYADYEPRERLFVPSADDPTEYEPFWADEITERALLEKLKATPGVKSRHVDFRRIKWCVITATDVLMETEWAGRSIPIIQVIGKKYNVNGERCYKGIISNSKDAQRGYNYMRSAMAEVIALNTKSPWVMAEGQDEGYETMWDEANVRNFARLIYRPTTFEGHLVPPPQRQMAEPPIQAFVLAVQMWDEDIKSTTGRHDASLGKYRASESGVAIRERQEQGERSSSNYVDNLANISMVREARILLEAMPAIYDRPGRVIRLIGDDPKKDEYALLGVPFLRGPGGMPVRALQQAAAGQPSGPVGTPQVGPAMGGSPDVGMPGPMGPGGPPMAGPMAAPPKRRKPKLYTLTDGGEYSCVPSVGPSVATEQEQNSAMLEVLMKTVPTAAPHIAHLYAKQLQGPIGDEMAKVLMKLSPVASAPDDEESDLGPEAEAHIFALTQQMQQMAQALQALQADAAAKKYQVDANVSVQQAILQSRERIAQMQDMTKRWAVSQQAVSAEELAQFEAEADVTLKTLDHAHDRVMARQHERAEGEGDARRSMLKRAERPTPSVGNDETA